jgi:predicted sulfurtransferase
MKTKTATEIEAKEKSKKEKKAKKKSKKEKRKRGEDLFLTDVDQRVAGVNTDIVENRNNGDGESNRKKKKEKKARKENKKNLSKKDSKESSDDAFDTDNPADVAAAAASGGDQLVASSAIEFYDADVKKKARKRQKLITDNETTIATGNESKSRLEDVLEAKRSKSISKSKKDRRNQNDSDEKDQQKKRDELEQEKKHNHSLTLLLFYQYIEPEWDNETYEKILRNLKKIGASLELTGRMRCAREGLNCTLTGKNESILEYTKALRQLRPNDFRNTEFKLTTDLPLAQKFGELKILPVLEIVRYGLEGQKAPQIQQYSGVHLEPKDYHKKLAESNTVVIDVRNHYEAAIGRFVPPTDNSDSKSSNSSDDPQWIDPKMRKSTEFPAWLDKDETKEIMKGKQVLMYCTGGIRCERASALLKYKMETDPAVKDLGIKGVYQLQGGIDKYFKEFPDGGYWKGKNYVFDKRFAHAPPKIDGELHGRTKDDGTKTESCSSKKDAVGSSITITTQAMGKCEACHKPWDMYRGKRRCPTCGVPSLICKECFLADKGGTRKLGRDVRCDLCVEQNIFSKRDYKTKDERFVADYESKMRAKGLLLPNAIGGSDDAKKNSSSSNNNNNNDNNNNSEQLAPAVPNPKQITRLVLKNMCRKNMTEDALMEALPGITHIVWNTQRNRKNPGGEPIFTGMGWVEVATPEDAARAVARSNQLKLFKRPLGIAFQQPDGKDIWPPHNSKVAF